MVDFAVTAEGSPEAEALIASWATGADRLHAERRSTAAGRSRALTGRALMRWLVEVTTGLDGRAWRVLTDARGKPCLLAPDRREAPAVSLSHGGGLVACAVTRRGLLGLDVEAHRPGRHVSALAEFAFGEGERAEVNAQGSPAFYRIWTLREAIAKATGEGLSQAADGRDRVAGSPERGAWTGVLDDRQWLLAHLEPRPGFSLAMAVLPRSEEAGRGWSLGSPWNLSGLLRRSRSQD